MMVSIRGTYRSEVLAIQDVIIKLNGALIDEALGDDVKETVFSWMKDLMHVRDAMSGVDRAIGSIT